MFKRFAALLLMLSMLLSMLSVTSFAAYPASESTLSEMELSKLLASVETDGSSILLSSETDLETGPLQEDVPDLEPDFEESALLLTVQQSMMTGSELYSTLSGRVIDTEGHGVVGVSVSLYDLSYNEFIALAETDVNGNWVCETAVLGNDYFLRFHSRFHSFPIKGLNVSASAEAVSVDTVTAQELFDPSTAETPAADFEYTLLNATHISITGYNGSADKLVIPEMIDDYIVHGIGTGAFQNNATLKEIILPRRLQTIYSSAFYGCTALEYVGFNDALETISPSAFYGCTALDTIDLPNSLLEIQNHAFYNCTVLEQVLMPLGLIGINGYAFAHCERLAGIAIPDSVTGIGYRAFYRDIALSSVVLPRSWKYALSYSSSGYTGDIFKGCTALTAISVPEGISALPNYAFEGCDTLVTVTLPTSLATIGSRAFYECTALTNIAVPASVSEIGSHAFHGCTALSAVSLSNGLQRINSSAFYGCTALTSLALPDSVVGIGSSAFYGCTMLSSINLPLSWETVYALNSGGTHGSIFAKTALTSLTVPEGITTLPDYAFMSCPNLTEISLPTTLQTIGYRAFYECTGLTALDIPDSVTTINAQSFANCISLEAIVLHEGLEQIYASAFMSCTSLVSVAIPDSVVGLGSGLFSGCTALTSVSLPLSWEYVHSYDSIGSYAGLFPRCTALTTVTVPEGITALPGHAFQECAYLTGISLPSTLTEIGDYSFSGCIGLSSLSIPDSVKTIGYSAFRDCSGLTAVTLPSALNHLDEYAFLRCTQLTAIAIPDGCTHIGQGAFEACAKLSSVTLPTGWATTSGSGEIFYGCPALISLTIPEGVTTIPRYAFRYTPNLRTVILPDSVSAIAASAFEGCANLRSIWIGAGTGSIENNVFKNCSLLTIHGTADSTAEAYAAANSIPFSTAPLNAETVSFSGTVTGAGAGVSVTLYDITENLLVATTLTDANSSWSIADVPAGHDYALRTYSPYHSVTPEVQKFTSVFANVSAAATATQVLSPDIPASEDFTYSVTSGNFISITGYTGSDSTVVIPDSIDTYTVQSIGSNAFKSNTAMECLVLPDTVMTIGSSAFEGCTSLRSIHFGHGIETIGYRAFRDCTALEQLVLPNGVTTLDRYAFYGCSELTSISLPYSLEELCAYAFYRCTSLTSVVLPEALSGIGYCAFAHCENLTSVVLPLYWETALSDGSAQAYCGSIFSNCPNLTAITVPEGMTRLPDYAFRSCTNLTQIHLPSSLEIIGQRAFYECTGLTKIDIPENVTEIGSYAFYNCSNLAEVTMHEGLEEIQYDAFSKCSSLVSVHLPDSVTGLGYMAFYDCANLEEINIPLSWSSCLSNGSSIAYFGSIFYNCPKLTEITVPEGITTLPEYAFQGCNYIKKINLPSTLTSIGSQAFQDCTALTAIILPEGVTAIPYRAFYGCSGLTSLPLSETTTEVGHYAFANCTGLQSAVLPSGVRSIGYRAFYKCENLSQLSLPSGWETVPAYSSSPVYFGSIVEGCTSLVSLTLPEGITVLPGHAFKASPSLKTVILPQSLTEIGTNAFSGCSELENIWIDKNVTEIGSNAFNGHGDLTIYGVAGSYAEAYANENDIPFVPNSIAESFLGLGGSVVTPTGTPVAGVSVSVFDIGKNELVGIYATDALGAWNCDMAEADKDYTLRYYSPYYTFASECVTVTMGGTSTLVPSATATELLSPAPSTPASDFTYRVLNGTFVAITSYTGSASTVTVPDTLDGYTVQAIGSEAFYSNKTLESVILPPTVTEIGYRAFCNCSALRYVGFGTGLELIGEQAFERCTALEQLRFPNTLKDIDDQAFFSCSNLREFSLPNGLERIGLSVFYSCPLLETVDLPDSVATIGSHAFSNCSALNHVKLPLGWSEVDYTSYTGTVGAIFSYCPNLISIHVPDGVTALPDYAFRGCTSLKEISLPDSLERVGSYAFYGCTGLSEFSLPSGVTELGSYAFCNCTALSNITLSDCLITLGVSAFNGCTALESVRIPDRVETIGSYAFYGCTALRDVTLPPAWNYVSRSGSTSSFGNIFTGCTSLTEITVPDGMRTLPDNAFRGASSLSSIRLPDSLLTIGSDAFDGCSGIGSLVIPEGVTTIGANAFEGCTGLSSITLPEDLLSLGNYAFTGCTALTSVDIPDGTQEIGYRAFYNCTHLTSLALPFAWTKSTAGSSSSYGHIVEGCTSLIQLEVPEGVAYIPPYSFENCTSLVTVVLPSTLKSIGNDAFDGCTALGGADLSAVESIGNYAFAGCTALEDLILSDELRTIGSYAFNKCSSLADVVLPPCLETIGSYAFNNTAVTELEVPPGVNELPAYCFANCASLTKITLRRTVTSIAATAFSSSPNVVIYCYADSAAHNFAVSKGIRYVLMAEPMLNGSELDNSYTSMSGTDKYGNPVSTRLYVYEYKSLKRISNAQTDYTNGHLTLEHDDYYPVDIPSCTLVMGNSTKLAMVPENTESYIAAVHCEGYDALVNNLQVLGSETSLEIRVYTTLLDAEVVSYQLMQDASVVATSKTGVFDINPSRLTYNKPLSVRMVSAGGKCTKLKTNITVVEELLLPDTEITIGEKVEFSIPSDVPLIGGGEIKIDFTVLPVFLAKEGDTFRIGIGCKRDLLENEFEWLSFKKYISDQKEDLKKGLSALLAVPKKGVVSAGMEKGFDLEVYGFAEGTIGLNGLEQRGGGIIFKITGEVEKQWQTAIYFVPIVLKLKGEAGLDARLSLGLDFNNAKLYFDGKVDLTIPQITASGGVGLAYVADVSVYGEGKNLISINTRTDAIAASLFGEIGGSATVFGWTYKKSFLDGSWQYLYSGNVNNRWTAALMSPASGSYQRDRNYVYAQSDWLEENRSLLSLAGLSAAGANLKTLQTSVFYSADPQLVVTESGQMVMVWISDIPERSHGNHTAIVYSVCDAGSSSWSDPVLLDDDGTSDFHPAVTVKGDTVYIAWTDSARDDFTAEDTMEATAAACEISVATLDPATGAVSEASLTDNSVLDFYPQLAVVNETVHAVWIRNEANDAAEMSGANAIYHASYNGVWSEASEYTHTNSTISALAVGNLNGAHIAYVCDTDGSISTVQDGELYLGAVDATAAPVTTNTALEQTPQFATIASSPVLAWYSGGNLCYTTGSAITTIPGTGFGPDFVLADVDGESAIISIAPSDTGSELYLCDISLSEMGPCVMLSSTGAYVGTFSAAYHDGQLWSAMTEKRVNITSQSLYETTDLCVLTVGSYADLSLLAVEFDPQAITPGGQLPVELTVKNNGTADVSGLTIRATLNSSSKLSTTAAVSLPAGETVVVPATLTLESGISADSDYEFRVTPTGMTDADSSDNTLIAALGDTDLHLTVESIHSDGTYSALVTVENLSYVATEATLRVRKDDANGEVLGRWYIGSIGEKASETMSIDSALLKELADQDTTLYFEVLAAERESALVDNCAAMQVAAASPELRVNVSINGVPYTFSTEVTGGCSVYAAAYNTDGALLAVSSTGRFSSDAEAALSLNGNDIVRGCTVKVFLLDQDMKPLSEAPRITLP